MRFRNVELVCIAAATKVGTTVTANRNMHWAPPL